MREENSTVFVIAQRISTVRDADLILVLDDGKFAARGTHQELLRESELDLHPVVHLPASFAGRTIQEYVVDDQHSDGYDAGPAHADLEQIASSTLSSDGTASLTLRARRRRRDDYWQS